MLICDGRRLQQVLLNLLINAIKFTREGGVRLEARWQGSTSLPPGQASGASGVLHLAVHDSGPGLSVPARARLFESYAPHGARQRLQQSGAGLGLSICRELVQLMGGQIRYQGGQPSGSSFLVELPMRVLEMRSL